MADDFDVDGAIAATISLLSYYGFDLENNDATAVVDSWRTVYPTAWLKMAVLEALYRGRYKQVSVEEILRSWQKWDKVRCNFDLEFESLICSKLEKPIIAPATDTSEESHTSSTEPTKPSSEVHALQSTPTVPETYQKLKAIAVEQAQILAEEQED